MKLLTHVLPYTIAFFVALLFQRCIEFFRAPDELLGETIRLSFLLKGVFFDVLTSFLLTGIALFIQLPFSYLFKTQKLLVFHFFMLLFLVINFALIEFFLLANEPLTESVFTLSLHEMKIIGGSGDRISFGMIMALLTVFVMYFFLAHFFKKKSISTRTSAVFGMALLVSFFLLPFSTYTSSDSHTETIFVNNRLADFCTTSIHAYIATSSKKDTSTELFSELDERFLGGKKIETEFPLLHTLSDKSEFSDLFKTQKAPPNIVFIIVESLSTSLVGEKADKTGHIMPYLDSLSTKSIYFPNFLSTCERTHNVLPASLSSLPNAPVGEMFMKMEHSDHWSLISLLKKQYYSRFYCGVDLSYSNMNGFMNFQKTNYLVKNWEKPAEKKLSNRENSWGYTDGQIFDKSWKDYTAQSLNKKKRLDIFLTISTHEPFVIPNQAHYTQKVKARINRIVKPTKTQLEIKDNADKFAAYSYLDDELRNYFDKAKQNPDFENTLFFIFGDHGTSLCLYDEMEKYKIPLIIYSPLIKKPQTIRSVSTHLDLAPTLINYLRLTHKLPLPEKVPFIGHELSLVKKFECKRSLPFNSVNLKNDDLLFNNYFFSHDRLFKVKEGLKLVQVHSDKQMKLAKKQLEYYNCMSEYVFYRNKIIPQAIYASFVKTDEFVPYFKYTKAELSKAECKAEFMDLGKNLTLPVTTKLLKINVSCEAMLNSKSDLMSVPFLTVGLTQQMNDKDSVLFWEQVHPFLLQSFNSNNWNKIEYTMTIRSKNIGKLLNKNQLAYYLLNYDKKEFKIRNVKTIIFTNPVTKKGK